MIAASSAAIPAPQAKHRTRFAARLRFEPVEQQHQGDQQRHREQGQRQRDEEGNGTVPCAREALQQVDTEDDQGARQPGGNADDEPGPGPPGRAALDHGPRVKVVPGGRHGTEGTRACPADRQPAARRRTLAGGSRAATARPAGGR
jgi:hypothetical protein